MSKDIAFHSVLQSIYTAGTANVHETYMSSLCAGDGAHFLTSLALEAADGVQVKAKSNHGYLEARLL